MKIAIIGCGAMGSVYAGLLAAAGHEVWAIDTWAEHVRAIRERGLRVEGASGDRAVPVHATTDAREAGPCELVILATKVMHVGAAAEAARALLGPETVVLSIQNGLGGPDRAAAVLGRERVMVGVVGGFGASIRAPGHVHHNGMELVRLGEFGGPITPRLERVAEVWRSAGFRVRTFDDIDQLVWEKLICNCTFSATCALLGRTIGEVMADPDAWRVASGCAAEAFAVARARGVRLGFDEPVAYVRDFGGKIPNARPSLLLDLTAGRRSEIDAINGAIPPAAEAVGLAAPVNATVSALVRAKERGLGGHVTGRRPGGERGIVDAHQGGPARCRASSSSGTGGWSCGSSPTRPPARARWSSRSRRPGCAGATSSSTAPPRAPPRPR